MDVNTLLIESEWGESKFFFREPMCLHDIFATLKALGFRPEMLTEAMGVARVFHPGSFLDVYDLESQLISASIVCGCKSKVVEEPNDFCPVIANFASICNEVEHATKTSRVGGAVPKGTEETKEQGGETLEGDQFHAADSKDYCGYPSLQREEEQADSGRDPEHVSAHHARNEVTFSWWIWIILLALWFLFGTLFGLALARGY